MYNSAFKLSYAFAILMELKKAILIKSMAVWTWTWIHTYWFVSETLKVTGEKAFIWDGLVSLLQLFLPMCFSLLHQRRLCILGYYMVGYLCWLRELQLVFLFPEFKKQSRMSFWLVKLIELKKRRKKWSSWRISGLRLTCSRSHNKLMLSQD